MLDTPRRVTEMKIPFTEHALSGDQSRRLPCGEILASEATSPIFPRIFEGTRVAFFEIGPAK
jgi:hypothetical protein